MSPRCTVPRVPFSSCYTTGSWGEKETVIMNESLQAAAQLELVAYEPFKLAITALAVGIVVVTMATSPVAREYLRKFLHWPHHE